MTKSVAIVGGTGSEGSGLAYRWAKSGQYRVILGSREVAKAVETATTLNRKLGQDVVIGCSNREAVGATDLCVLTVPYTAQAAVLTELSDLLQGKILINVSVPLKPPQVSRVYIPPGGSAGQEAQAILGEKVQVVCAFQNVSAAHLLSEEAELGCDVLVCGDDNAAKREAVALAVAAGMRGLDAGPLQNAVVVEGLTPILIGLNRRYNIKNAGLKITGT
jgi:hypothetical protein